MVHKISRTIDERITPDFEIPKGEPVTKTIGSKKHFPIKFIIIPLSVLFAIVAMAGLMALPLRGVIAALPSVIANGKETMTAVKNQDIAKAKEGLAKTRQSLTVLDGEYQKIRGMKVIPLIGAYVSDGEHGIKAGFAALTAGDKAVEALEPNADLLGLKGKSTFVAGTAEDRLQMAVKTMRALTPKIQEMASSVETMRNELDAIDPMRYPKNFRGIAVRDQMTSGKAVIEEAANLFVNAQPLLMKLPDLLGDPTDKRYLVLFQNDKELRATGGFLTAYARFRMVKGKPVLEKADDIYTLDAALKKTYPATREILTFHKGVNLLNIRDSNLSPDFKTSMMQFESMYKNTSANEPLDGIIAVDTHVLVETLKILGPMNVYGITFSADTDKRCDCPKAVYELEDYSSRPVGYVRSDRKDIIGVLLHEILKMALGVSPSKYWGSLFQMLITEINQKHVLAYFHDDAAQKAAESFNMAGRIMAASESAAVLKYKEDDGWDYLHVNNSNMAGAKSNMFVTEKITKDVSVSGNTITTKLTIDYKNPYPGSDCGLESGGLCLNAPLRNWIRIYVPKGSSITANQGAVSPKDGKPMSLDTYESLGKTVFEGFLIVNPLGTAKMDVTYTTPLSKINGYKLLFQKQAGTSGDEFILKVDGKEKKRMPIISDVEFSL